MFWQPRTRSSVMEIELTSGPTAQAWVFSGFMESTVIVLELQMDVREIKTRCSSNPDLIG